MNEQFGVIDSVETAFGHLEAFIAGGDELGEVPEKDAIDAVNYLRTEIEALKTLAQKGMDLSMWAAAINWYGKKDNTSAWLDGLKSLIEDYQSSYKAEMKK